MILDSLYKGLVCDIDSKVNYLKARAFKHQANQIFSYIVEISRRGSKNDDSFWRVFLPCFFQITVNHGKTVFHTSCRG